MSKITPAPFDVTGLTPIREAYLLFCDLKAGQQGSNKEILVQLFEFSGKSGLLVQFGKVGSVEGRSAQKDWTVPASIRTFDDYVHKKTHRGSTSYKLIPRASVSAAPVVVAKKLDDPVSKFLSHIFDEANEYISGILLGSFMDIDPSHISDAKIVLQSIGTALKNNHRANVIELSSNYYSLIPHKTGLGELQIPRRIIDPWQAAVNSNEKLAAEFDFLQSLKDSVESKAGAIAGASTNTQMDSIGADITLADDKIAKRISRFVLSTKGVHFNLDVGKVFVVQNKTTRQRYDACPVGNEQELFHGSRNANILGLIRRSVLIAPAGIPATGKMFGRGAYFADQSTKSAQYAVNTPRKRTPHYLFVCGVKLGKIKEEYHAVYYDSAPRGYDSVKGVPSSYGLRNAEFIVYKEAQVYTNYVIEITRC